MKVFACKRQGSCSGGLIIVAANTLDEAFHLFAYDEKYDWMIDYFDKNGEWAPKEEAVEVRSDYYPKEAWFEVPELRFLGNTPKILLESGYTE